MGIMEKKPKEEIIIMEKKKSYGVLIAGAILLILGIVLAVITHNNSYQELPRWNAVFSGPTGMSILKKANPI